ncbi:MAG TPA: glycosyltransferase [Gemmataceae bacterium]
MTLRYLIGPISAPQAWRCWSKPRQEGACRAFNAVGDLGLRIEVRDSWEEVCRCLPGDWRPDVIALQLSAPAIPQALWSVPVPLVGLAFDWDTRWHGYRHLLPLCDLILTDAPGVEVMRRAGFRHVCQANLNGLDPHTPEGQAPGDKRSLDVVFAGSIDQLGHRHRSAWLGRLGRLAGRWRIAIRTGLRPQDYQTLLHQARIVFNHSSHGECNRRVFEVAAAGALLFQEEDNREVLLYFQPGREYVAYNADNLEALLEHYLSHEDERVAIAQAAQARVRAYRSEDLWQRTLEQLSGQWDDLQERARLRSQHGSGPGLSARVWQAAAAGDGSDPHLLAEVTTALQQQPGSAPLHNDLGLLVSVPGLGQDLHAPDFYEKVTVHFHQAFQSDRHHFIAGLNLVETLVGAGRKELAVAGAKHLLAQLERGLPLTAAVLDAGHFPPVFDVFRQAWERAAWANAGQQVAEEQAKCRLLRWRLHDVLAQLTGEMRHYQEAACARPDDPVTRARLGCACGMAKQPAAAVEHLRHAAASDPFDNQAARALYQALEECGDKVGARRLARDHRLLAQAAPQLVPAQRWFIDAPPVGDELASIIVLCLNEVDYTRLCLESVLRHTRPPYELILVDNGSTDGTHAYLQEVRALPGPVHVEILRNDTNLGFPTGCNQGWQKARGRYVVFLNNDTVVTAGWLDGLVAWSLHDWPTIGLVGAVTNNSRPPQQIPVDYHRLEDLHGFAARRQRDYAGKAREVERLTGFCLLARQEVLQRLGGFDERFGTGLFDDDDLCVRARRAGLRLLLAQDVFVHHFGSRTFTALGLDMPAQLQRNFAQFKAKWGAQEADGYQLPGSDGRLMPLESEVQPTALVQSTAAAPARVSLCLIVKNEEHNLPACLGSATDLADEIIVVDTGSSDATREVAVRYGARVFDFPWCDSFAAARNECLRHATGQWIFWLDADDRLDEGNRRKLHQLFAQLNGDNAAYAMKCLCLPDAVTGSATVVDHMRLFRNHPAIRWQYRVHEQILPAVRRAGGVVRWTDIVIHHAGYQDPALRRRKLERDLRLLELEDAEHPDDPFTLFNLGSVRQELGQHAQAIPLLRRSLERSHPRDSIVRKVYALLVGCHRALGLANEALAACQEGRRVYSDDPELLFVESILRKDRGDLVGAESCLVQLLQARPAEHFASVDTGLQGYKARHNLALLRHQQGLRDDAESLWRAVVAERPDFLPGWLGLAEVQLARGACGEVEETARRVQSLREGVAEAAVLRARVHLVRREFGEARALLKAAIERSPQALGPRIVLSHALLQEDRDPQAAEQALRDVLALAPDNAETRHNLDLLLHRRAQDQAFADNFIRSEQPPALALTDTAPLARLYEAACATPSELNEHLPTLLGLAKECRHVTELGTRAGVSTTALLYARPDRLVCYDRIKHPQVDRLETLAAPTEFVFHQQDVWPVEIEPTDLLFIDTWHLDEPLHDELPRHAGKVRKYIVLHDTTPVRQDGETEGHRGRWPAIEEVLAEGRFRLQARGANNNGLTVLESLPEDNGR